CCFRMPELASCFPSLHVPRSGDNIDGVASTKLLPLPRCTRANVAIFLIARLHQAIVEAPFIPILLPDRQQFLFAATVPGYRFCIQMPSAGCKRTRYVLKAESMCGRPQPKF